jgi:putative colanic acid biosynthesis acetyltransferase WcaF
MRALDARVTKPMEGGATFSFQNRLYRFAWSLTWLALASWTPTFLLPWRRFLLRLFGATLGEKAVVHSSARIWYPPNLRMGAHACLGPNVICYSMAPIELGDFAIASQGAHLCTGTHDIEDEYFQLIARPIIIANRAWIAADAFVGPGVTVGEGAVLGARGVTVRDLQPWTVYAGNPARKIRVRGRVRSVSAQQPASAIGPHQERAL